MMKFKVHYSFILYLFIGLISPYKEMLFALLVFIIIHELGHLAAFKVLGIKVKQIEALPFGFYYELDELKNDYIHKSIIAYSSGILANILTHFILTIFFNANFVKYNLYILFFNIIPIFPLDGFHILRLFLCYFFSYNKVLNILKVINIVLLSFFGITLIFQFSISNMLIILYLFFQVKGYNSKIKSTYLLFLLEKKLHPNDKLKTKIIDSSNYLNKLYLGKYNLVRLNDKICGEEELLRDFLPL